MDWDSSSGDVRGEVIRWVRLLQMMEGVNGWRLSRSGLVWWRWMRSPGGQFTGTHWVQVSRWEGRMIEQYWVHGLGWTFSRAARA